MDVRRHDLAADDAETIERTARRLARAFGCGTAWRMPDTTAPDPDEPETTTRGNWTGGLLSDTGEERLARTAPDGESGLPSDVLQVVKRSKHVANVAARGVTGANGKRTERVTARHYWNIQRGRVLRAACSMDTDALAALGALPRLQQSMLLTYAGELHRWPHVARWCVARGHRIEAASAAMDRILWKRPDRTLAQHAWHIGMRKADFLPLVARARCDLDHLLIIASYRFVAMVGGNRKHPPNDSIGMDGQPTAVTLPIPRRRAA